MLLSSTTRPNSGVDLKDSAGAPWYRGPSCKFECCRYLLNGFPGFDAVGPADQNEQGCYYSWEQQCERWGESGNERVPLTQHR